MQLMVKSLIMAKYVQEQKYTQVGQIGALGKAQNSIL